MNHKDTEKKTSVGKVTGRSKTGKPLDKIDTNPQQKIDNDKLQREDAVDLTPPLEEGKALTIMQRQKRARIMRRYESKLERAREISKKRAATKQKLQVRAERAAREILKKRFSGIKGKPYAELSVAQKIQVDKRLEGKAALIKRLAARLLPKIRRKEFERLSSFYKGQQMKSLHSEPQLALKGEVPAAVQHESFNAEFETLFSQLLNKEDQTSIQQMAEEYTPETLINIIETMINELEETNPFKSTLVEMLDKVAPINPIHESLEKKSEQSGVELETLKTIFERGLEAWDGKQTQEQYAFARVNSYIAGGKAYELDSDLREKCWDGYTQKGMKKKNGKLVPNCVPVNEAGGAGDEGTTKLVKKYKKDTPCQKTNEMFEGYWKDVDTEKKETERLAKQKKKLEPEKEIEEEMNLSPQQKAKAAARAKEAGRPYPNPIDDAWASKQITEDLRKWFDQKWVRMDTKGKIKGDCAREEGEGKPKCLPLAQARAMDKEDRAKAARRKRREDPVADREGKGGKPVFVKTEEVEHLEEKNAPTNPELWSKAKSLAKSKFDVYPSAYANGWAAKWYKSKGGGWKSVSEETKTECAPGQYYCFEDKMCKPIPEGYKVGKDGMLVSVEKIDEVSRAMTKVLKKPSTTDLENDVQNFLSKGGIIKVGTPQKAKFKPGTALASKHDTTIARAAGGIGSKNQIKNLGLARSGALKKMLTITKKEKFAKEENEGEIENNSFTMNESFMLDRAAGIGQMITAADAGIEIKAGFVNYPGVEELSQLLQMESIIKHRFDNFISEGTDDEGAMAKSELVGLIKKAQAISSKMSSDKQLDAWVQSKITKAADYINSVHDFLMNNKQEVDK